MQNLLLLIAFLFSSSNCLAADDASRRIDKNLFGSRGSKASKESIYINVLLDNNGRTSKLDIPKGKSQLVNVRDCVTAIYKSEPFTEYTPQSFTYECKGREKTNTAIGKQNKKYMNEVSKKIKANWFPPSGSTQANVGVKFFINNEGRASGITVIRPSSNKDLDTACIKAIEISSPFPPPNLEILTNNKVEIDFSFDYNIHYRQPVNKTLRNTSLILDLLTLPGRI